jgi:protein-S-isoprenylcysteine O-methyltransferase Ste14
MRRHWFPKAYADVVARLRVPAGFLLVAAFGWWARPTAGSLAAGLPVAAAGLALRAWAAGHLAKNERLAVSGPYAWCRNPLYLGTLVVAAGLAAAARQPWLAVLFAAVFAGVYLPVVELEEQHLRKLFPEYEEYAARVPWLWPRRPGRAGGERFRWSLYLKNQEYNALAGFLAGVAWLAWRAWG